MARDSSSISFGHPILLNPNRTSLINHNRIFYFILHDSRVQINEWNSDFNRLFPLMRMDLKVYIVGMGVELTLVNVRPKREMEAVEYGLLS